MSTRPWIVAAFVGLAGALAWACGPMFPSQLLDQRAATLKAAPQNSFAYEAMHLLPPTDKLASNEPPPYGADDKDAAARARALGLSAAQLARVDALRALDSGDAAYAQGSDLPDDLRLYTAGAVDWDKHEADKATARFEQLLALPPEQARLRSVWAAYMLGRIHADAANAAASDASIFSRERAASAKAFGEARTRALDGASDTPGLAVASFGEEARLYLYSHGKQCRWADLYGADAASDEGDASDGDKQAASAPVDDGCGSGIVADDLKRAITLYAAQAGHGSKGAVSSLAAVADFVMRHPPLIDGLIDHPLSQRLLVAYALARMDGGAADTAAGAPVVKADPGVTALVDALGKRGVGKVVGVDRLAALAYQRGSYAEAARLVELSSGPLSEWVRAKLALQKGDLAAANAAYAAAAKAFPRAGDPAAAIEPSNVPLIEGEHGVLAMARGEYVEAMGHLYDAALAVGGDGNVYDWDEEDAGAGYGNDALYVAERVLTVDELKTFIDARAPATPVPTHSPDAQNAWQYRSPIADTLRWVLARRLMRDGRYDEAMPYFPADNDWRFGTYDDNGKLQWQSFRAPARAYADALRDSRHAWRDIDKAQAFYAAAAIARRDGMQILGYQQGPDFADVDGGYQGGSGQSAASMQQPDVTDGERQRYAASEARPNYRFHYRYIAADEAMRAADLLPPRSQAFAAVTCQATAWMLQGPPDYDDHYQGYGEPAPSVPPERLRRADAYYARYVKQGPYVAWAANFGRQCEEPDFARARALERAEQVAAVKHAVRRYWPFELAATVVVIVVLALWIVRRRRRRRAP